MFMRIASHTYVGFNEGKVKFDEQRRNCLTLKVVSVCEYIFKESKRDC